ncbi:MAG: alpha/beta hydrolase [Haloarculaceae archaeon]
MVPQSHVVTSPDGLDLNVWERSPAAPTEAVLFVHGVLTNARALFDTPVPDDDSYSWLLGAATRGRAAFAMDQRGYGDSDLPPEMDEPPEANDPPVRAERAAEDIAAVVEYVREDYDTVHLVGVSWGSHTCGKYLERDEVGVASMTYCEPVYKPAYDYREVREAIGIPGHHRGHFEQDRETVRARSDHPPEVFDAVWEAQIHSNQGVDEDSYVAQAGGIADWAESTAGDPVWDPAKTDVPALVTYGSEDDLADRQGSLSCFDDLTVEQADYVEFVGVDHYPMHSERRQYVFDTVSDFQDRV